MLVTLSVPVIGGFFWNELKKPGASHRLPNPFGVPYQLSSSVYLHTPEPQLNSKSTNTQRKRTGLKLSQRIIHTRVQGQASVITILALTMGFREYMQKNGGRIKIDDDE